MLSKFSAKLCLFLSPLLILIIGYFVFDPFKIVKTYDSYPDNFAKSLNRDRISTQIFINNNPKYHYKSFIFGSSRSSVFYARNWGKHINDATPYHFDASCETISGIASKLKFIESKGNQIENALFVFDRSIFNYEQDTLGSVFVQDYRVSGLSWWKYHLIFINTYFSKGFFIGFYDYAIFNNFRKYMRNFLEFRKINYTPVVNDFIFTSYIEQIKADSINYYNQPNFFYERSKNKNLPSPAIKKYQLKYLQQIKEVLARKKTNFKIVLGPTYDQNYFNKSDYEFLVRYFGKENIYDFSGINEYTNDKTNYYEIYHYKPVVANQIMDKIYATK
ncbi:hypothetical protein EMA8858_01125 [Emticicia aquatica]|jgi:hypothetical protein|uniref:Uncharacterized protein n=1 Tax=Emticicia aquatica TaxID=1681835 RepID=A0ABN8EQ13_9BACT|nr:hypothetical protein [Emticicia aquatica]CAH0995005.1 hypothetical protein EMA8858_01125 [Emticicia aquatica]